MPKRAGDAAAAPSAKVSRGEKYDLAHMLGNGPARCTEIQNDPSITADSLRELLNMDSKLAAKIQDVCGEETPMVVTALVGGDINTRALIEIAAESTDPISFVVGLYENCPGFYLEFEKWKPLWHLLRKDQDCPGSGADDYDPIAVIQKGFWTHWDLVAAYAEAFESYPDDERKAAETFIKTINESSKVLQLPDQILIPFAKCFRPPE